MVKLVKAKCKEFVYLAAMGLLMFFLAIALIMIFGFLLCIIALPAMFAIKCSAWWLIIYLIIGLAVWILWKKAQEEENEDDYEY